MQQIFDLDTFRHLYSSQFTQKLVEKGVRADGRNFEQLRGLHGTIGSITSCNGSSLVKLGNTVMICGIKAEVASPSVAEPECGFIVPNVVLSPICSEKYGNNSPPSESAQYLSERINSLFKENTFFDRKQLCIVKDKLAWVLHAEITCINEDGSLLDASLLALVLALHTVSLPRVELDELNGKGKVVQSMDDEEYPKRLAFSRIPISVTCALTDKGFMADLTAEEEGAFNKAVNVIFSSDGKIFSINSVLGIGSPVSVIDPRILQQILSLSKERFSELEGILLKQEK